MFTGLTPTLKTLKFLPEVVDDASMAVIEMLVVLLYDRTCNLLNVNEARQELFSKKSRTLDNFPPTQEALLQHTKRAFFHGSFISSQSLLKEPVIPSPAE